jgi:hypothetical protein
MKETNEKDEFEEIEINTLEDYFSVFRNNIKSIEELENIDDKITLKIEYKEN